MGKARTERQAADLVVLTDPGDAKTVEIMLTPWGKVKTVDGRDFVVDEESVREIIAAFTALKKDIPIDFEHTSEGGEYGTRNGAAPASGWITKIYAKAGVGIFAAVKWNETARAMIRGDEYRYLSPVVIVRKDDRKAVAVRSAALTNTPAIIDMERLAAKENENGESTMDLGPLKETLLKAGVRPEFLATDDGVVAAALGWLTADALAKAEPPPLTAVAAKLGLDKSATTEAIVAKVAELQTYVSPTEYKVVTARLEALELVAKDREGQELVACAIESAKLNPNDEKQMTWARGYAKADAIGFKAWSDNSPALYSAGRLVTASAKLDGGEGRAVVILAAKEEYKANPKHSSGNRLDSWVDQTLRDKNMTVLSDAEKKSL